MQLNEKHIQILRIIDEGSFVSNYEIQDRLGFSINFINYYLELFDQEGYLKKLHKSSDGTSTYRALLNTKGKLAVESPEDLIPEPNPVINTISIPGSVNAPIGGILQNSDQNTVTVNQNVDQSITEVLKSIDNLSQAIEDFPEDERELATVHLDNLKQEVQQPEPRKPQIKAALWALFLIGWSLLGNVGTVVTTAADFVNNVTDLAGKFNIELPQLPQVK